MTLRPTKEGGTATAAPREDERMTDSAGLGSGHLFTVAEVAARLRVSNMTVYRLIKSEQLQAVRVGKSYRISSDSMHSYLLQFSTKS